MRVLHAHATYRPLHRRPLQTQHVNSNIEARSYSPRLIFGVVVMISEVGGVTQRAARSSSVRNVVSLGGDFSLSRLPVRRARAGVGGERAAVGRRRRCVFFSAHLQAAGQSLRKPCCRSG